MPKSNIGKLNELIKQAAVEEKIELVLSIVNRTNKELAAQKKKAKKYKKERDELKKMVSDLKKPGPIESYFKVATPVPTTPLLIPEEVVVDNVTIKD